MCACMYSIIESLTQFRQKPFTNPNYEKILSQKQLSGARGLPVNEGSEEE